MSHFRVQSQAERARRCSSLETRELAEGVEDQLVTIGHDLVNLVLSKRDRIAVHFSTKFFASQASLVETAGRHARHVFFHERKGAPARKAFEREYALGPRALLNEADLLHRVFHA